MKLVKISKEDREELFSFLSIKNKNIFQFIKRIRRG